MDARSIRALLNTCKCPLGEAGNVVMQFYQSETKEKAGQWIVLKRKAPNDRCDHRDGRGRCTKRVSSGAIQQFCGVHQQCGNNRLAGDNHANFITREWQFFLSLGRRCGMTRNRPPDA